MSIARTAAVPRTLQQIRSFGYSLASCLLRNRVKLVCPSSDLERPMEDFRSVRSRQLEQDYSACSWNAQRIHRDQKVSFTCLTRSARYLTLGQLKCEIV